MFHSSTQRSHWLFRDSNELNRMRQAANQEYIMRPRDRQFDFLTPEEERTLLLHYEYELKKFCGRFQPAITILSVVGTSMSYFKRFYLRNSVMDYHPKDIFLVCVYLACKIEEFNISITQFVNNISTREDKEELKNVILNYEMLLMEKLDFQLTIHNFYRPFEGFLVDIKSRFQDISNPDILRQSASEFLDKILNTDGILLYPPSQIALTALVYSSSKNRVDSIDRYCRTSLLSELNGDEVKQMLAIIKNINRLLKDNPLLNQEEIRRIEMKLNECYNKENDPRSQEFKEQMRKHLEEDDELF